MIEEELRTYLKGFAAIRDATPGGCWPGKSPAKVRGDRLILRKVTGDTQYSIVNELAKTGVTMQIDAYSSSPAKARDLHHLVRNVLSGYRGDAGDVSIEGTQIVSERATEEEPEDGSDKWTHRYSADYFFFHTQTAPTHA